MKLQDFVQKAWAEHAANSSLVAARLPEGLALVESEADLTALGRLIHHVYGEHLGQWAEGQRLLRALQNHSLHHKDGESGEAIRHFTTSLQLCSGSSVNLSDFSGSEQARIYALAASNLAGQGQGEKAGGFLRKAASGAENLANSDQAQRAIAVASNNLACGLEEKPERTPAETALMVFAAKTSRKHWELAGTWLQVERAEYRLAMALLAAGEAKQALVHAEQCKKIVTENNAPALELFSAQECLARVKFAQNDPTGAQKALEAAKQHFEALSGEDKAWCQTSLNKINELAAKV